MLLNLTERAFRLMAAARVEGCLVEFGVYKGGSLSTIARLARKYLRQVPPIYGFDSFEGMPATTVPLEEVLADFWGKGTFGDTSLEAVEARLRADGVRATLVKEVFSDLHPLGEYGIDKVRFAHLDADIYEGYRDALHLLTPHLQVGTVMLFDEIVPPTEWRYQSVRHHGQRAVEEWVRETGFNLHLVRSEWTVALGVLVDEEYLRRYTREIVRLRADTLGESLRHIGKLLLGRELDQRVHLE